MGPAYPMGGGLHAGGDLNLQLEAPRDAVEQQDAEALVTAWTATSSRTPLAPTFLEMLPLSRGTAGDAQEEESSTPRRSWRPALRGLLPEPVCTGDLKKTNCGGSAPSP